MPRIIDRKKKESGFTLIELLVSVGIIALISGLFLTNYRKGGKNAELQAAAAKMASDIRLAQDNALGAKEFSAGSILCGWGVYLNESSPSSYIIFADLASDQDCSKASRARDPGEDSETVFLPSGITIYDISGGTFGNVVFAPPDPIVYINGNENSGNLAITLKSSSTGAVKTVSVNFFGLIEIN